MELYNKNMQSGSVVVAQIGSRHHYAIPRMLSDRGMLAGLYTDANAYTGIGSLVHRIQGIGKHNALKRLALRVPRGIPKSLIRSTDKLIWRQLTDKLVYKSIFRTAKDDDILFDRIVSSWEFTGADTLYAMQKHGTRLLEAAKAKGVRTVVEVFITPTTYRIVQNERCHYPDMERPAVDDSLLDLEDDRTGKEIACADLILSPGENVVEGLKTFAEFKNKTSIVVPYGCGVDFGGRANHPIKGRVLFAGSANLRKGIHYLGMAAEMLKLHEFDFRVAGGVSQTIASHRLTRELNFLGYLSRDAMKEEFLNADILVLPTLAEGCASVVNEALVARCPVVTTISAGTSIQSGLGGVIVPERDPVALADAISSIILSRSYREHLSQTCISLSRELEEKAWGDRLAQALYPKPI